MKRYYQKKYRNARSVLPPRYINVLIIGIGYTNTILDAFIKGDG